MPKRQAMQLTDDQRVALVRREDGPRTWRQHNRLQVFLRIATASSPTPDGKATGTTRMLVKLRVVEKVSDDTILRVLKKRPQAVAEGVVVPLQGG